MSLDTTHAGLRVENGALSFQGQLTVPKGTAIGQLLLGLMSSPGTPPQFAPWVNLRQVSLDYVILEGDKITLLAAAG